MWGYLGKNRITLEQLQADHERIGKLIAELPTASEFRQVSKRYLERAQRNTDALRGVEEEAFGFLVQIIDLALPYDQAEPIIGDLWEAYLRRLPTGGHAKRWLMVQIGWVLFNRAVDILRQVAAARAGK